MVTVITKTIGPTGRDYSTFTLAEADVTNIGTSADLVANDEAIVFEADAGDYSENFQFFTNGALTCDATRNVTWTHAAGAGHGGQFESGVNIVGYCLAQEAFAIVDGLSVSPSSGVAGQITNGVEGVIFRNLMAYSATSNAIKLSKGGTSAFPGVVENCVAKADSSRTFDIRAEGSGVDSHWRIVNTTVFAAGLNQSFAVGLSSSDTIYLELTNNLALSDRVFYDFGGATLSLTGSNNFGAGSPHPFPVAVQGSPYPITASTAYDPGAGDFALYVGKNGALLDSPHNDVIDGGVGPASNSDVPTTDILGDTRSGTTTNPGAFALAQATTTITKTIGPIGRDYTTFTLAEADVTNIGTSADLVANNEAIVFEADAGVFSHPAFFNSSLTTDPTRNVTYRAATGNEHGGSSSSGVRLQNASSNGPTFDDDFTALEGLVFLPFPGATVAYGPTVRNAEGNTFRNCISDWRGNQRDGFAIQNGSSSAPTVLENCVLIGDSTFTTRRSLTFESGSSTSDLHAKIRNCTIINEAGRGTTLSGSGDITIEFINCLSLGPNAYSDSSSGTTTITGSNCFGASADPWPVSVQGSPYPVTATTNTTPGFGDYAIYNASTGALVVVDDNAALGGGVGPAANADVPVYDINGVKRIGGGCDPGAFEGVRSRSLDVWDVVTATHNTPGTFGEMMQQVYLLTRTAAAGRIV